MSVTFTGVAASNAAQSHAEFLELIPKVERQARFAFRGRPEADREEAAAEAVAAAYVSYVNLKARGKNPLRDFPSALIAYAVLHAKVGRQVGSPNSTTDALSPLAQRKRGFKVEPLPASTGIARDRLKSTSDQRQHDEFEEWLRDNTRSAVPDQVAFRLDFPPFLAGLGRRNRALARFLALGHSPRPSSRGRIEAIVARYCRSRSVRFSAAFEPRPH